MESSWHPISVHEYIPGSNPRPQVQVLQSPGFFHFSPGSLRFPLLSTHCLGSPHPSVRVHSGTPLCVILNIEQTQVLQPSFHFSPSSLLFPSLSRHVHPFSVHETVPGSNPPPQVQVLQSPKFFHFSPGSLRFPRMSTHCLGSPHPSVRVHSPFRVGRVRLNVEQTQVLQPSIHFSPLSLLFPSMSTQCVLSPWSDISIR